MRIIAVLAFITSVLLILVGCGPTQGEEDSRAPEIIEQSCQVSLFTTAGLYEAYEDVRVVFSNTAQVDLYLLPTEGEVDTYRGPLRFYQRTSLGWRPVFPNRTTLYVTPDQPTTVGAESATVSGVTGGIRDISAGFGNSGAYLARIEYRDSETTQDTPELWQYSNEFAVILPQDSYIVPEFEIVYSVDESNIPNFHITNNWTQSIWLQPMCSTAHGVEETRYADDAYTNLQVLTELGWIVLQPLEQVCQEGIDPQEIGAGQTLYVDTVEWYHVGKGSLQPGIYRWDIVICLYGDLRLEGEAWLSNPRHIYSHPFQMHSSSR